jgi:hypothetical protein
MSDTDPMQSNYDDEVGEFSDYSSLDEADDEAATDEENIEENSDDDDDGEIIISGITRDDSITTVHDYLPYDDEDEQEKEYSSTDNDDEEEENENWDILSEKENDTNSFSSPYRRFVDEPIIVEETEEDLLSPPARSVHSTRSVAVLTTNDDEEEEKEEDDEPIVTGRYLPSTMQDPFSYVYDDNQEENEEVYSPSIMESTSRGNISGRSPGQSPLSDRDSNHFIPRDHFDNRPLNELLQSNDDFFPENLNITQYLELLEEYPSDSEFEDIDELNQRREQRIRDRDPEKYQRSRVDIYPYGTVYAIINNVNSLVYIGSTVLTLAERFEMHLGYMSNPKTSRFYLAMAQIGSEHFRIISIKTYRNITKKKLRQHELTAQLYFDTLNPAIGYNTKKGYRSKKKKRKVDLVEKPGIRTFNRISKKYYCPHCELACSSGYELNNHNSTWKHSKNYRASLDN